MALTLVALSAATAGAEEPSPGDTVGPIDELPTESAKRPDELAVAVEQGVTRFAQQRFAEALIHFDRALALTDDPAQVATLHFNGGVCLFELRSFKEAEQRFLTAAATKRTAEALLHAGFAASRVGALRRARRHQRSARALLASEVERELFGQLEQELSAAELHTRQSEFAALLRAAFEAVDHARPRRALSILVGAAPLLPRATTEQRANYHYALALAHHQLGDPKSALRELDQAVELAPRDAEFPRHRAIVHEQLGNEAAAARDYRAALDLGLLPELEQSSKASLFRLHPLKAPGWDASVHLSLGYDTNATQSGSAFARGIANQAASVGSPLGLVSLELGHRFRLASPGRAHDLPSSWDLTPAVSVTSFTLTAPAVRDLSIAAAAASVRLRLAPSLHTVWSATLATGAAFTGYYPTTPFTRDVSLALGFSTETRSRWTTDAGVFLSHVVGLGADRVLTGPRIVLYVGERLGGDVVSVFLRANGAYHGLGTERFAASSSSLPRCDGPFAPPACAELTFTVPLAYIAPELTTGFDWALSRNWVVQAQAAAQLRLYVDESTLSTSDGVVPESRKRRRDLRPELLVRGNYVLGAMALFAEQSVLVSASNLAPDLGNPAHRFDYEDRNYVQFISRVGVRADF